jgi:uncharacterized OB-fold protein
MSLLRLPPCPGSILTDRWSEPFWKAARQRRLVVCACTECGLLRMPPSPFCPNCQSQEITWREIPGTGRLYSYTIVHRSVIPGAEGNLPYAPAVVELDGAPSVRLVSAVVDAKAEDLRIDAPVEVCWHALTSGSVVPYFRLAQRDP